MAFLMLSEFELQPLGLGIKKEFIASLFINILDFVIFQLHRFFKIFTHLKRVGASIEIIVVDALKRVGASIEIIFADAFSQAKQNSFGMQCPAHF